MKNGKFDEGIIIKGKDLKWEILCKVISEDMAMRGYRYEMGMNVDVNPMVTEGSCEAGLHFCLVEDIHRYFPYGSKLALINIPDDEDVYVDDNKFRTHRLVIKKIMQLDEAETWMYLCKNGANVTAVNNYAVRMAAENGHLAVVKYLHKNGANIAAYNNYAAVYAAENGHLEVVKYLYENGANITVGDNYAVGLAARNGHLEVVKYLHQNGADITADNNYAVRKAAENGHLEVVKYLQANM